MSTTKPTSSLKITYPDGATVSRSNLVEPILAEQIQKGTVGLKKTALIFINGHLFQDPFVHQSSTFDAISEPILDLNLAHQDSLYTPLQCIQYGGDLV